MHCCVPVRKQPSHHSGHADSRAAVLLARLGLAVEEHGIAHRPLAPVYGGPSLVSVNPANGRALATVATTTDDDFDAVVAAAVEAARSWRDTPAPVRGNAVRRYAAHHTEMLRVLVRTDGFEYAGEVFPSLSAVAKRITGSHCNGFLFFKLTGGDS